MFLDFFLPLMMLLLINMYLIIKEQKLPNTEIAKQINKIFFDDFFKNLNEKLLKNAELEAISPGIGKLLSEHARAEILIRQVDEEMQKEFDDHLAEYEKNLRKKYKVRSLVKEWLSESLNEEKVLIFFPRYIFFKSF